MAKNKGQVTVFIILGIMMLLLILGTLFFVSRDKAIEYQVDDLNKIPIELQSIAVFVEDCIEEVSIPGIYLLAEQGGFIESYPDIIVREFEETAYHLDNNHDVGPDLEFIEKELSRFVENSLFLCVQEFETESYLNLSFGKINADTIIALDEVIIKIDYPISITRNEEKSVIREFRKAIPLRLGYLVELKEDIVEHIKETQETIDFSYFASLESEVRILPANKDTEIYMIIDEESVIDENILNFNFAVKSDFNENELPVVEEISPQVAFTNQNFNLQIIAEDPENSKLEFIDETALFDIDENGVIEFIPTPADKGNYNITLIVSDGVNDVENIMRLEIT